MLNQAYWANNVNDNCYSEPKLSWILKKFDKLSQDIYHTLISNKAGLQDVTSAIKRTQQNVNEIIFENSTPLFKGFTLAWQLIIQLLQKIQQLQQNREDFKDLTQQDYQITLNNEDTTNRQKKKDLCEVSRNIHFFKPNTKIKTLNDLKIKIQLKSDNLGRAATQILESLKSQATTRLISKNSISIEKEMPSQSKNSNQNQKARIDNLLQKCFDQKKNLKVLLNSPVEQHIPKSFNLLKRKQLQLQSDSQEDIADLKVRQHTKSQSLVEYKSYNFEPYEKVSSSRAKFINISPEMSLHEKPCHRKSLTYVKKQAMHGTHRSVKSAHLQEHKTKLFNIKETQLEALSNIHSKKVSIDQDELLITQRQ